MTTNLDEIRNDKKWQEMLSKDISLKETFDELDRIIATMESDLTFIKAYAKAKGIEPEMI